MKKAINTNQPSRKAPRIRKKWKPVGGYCSMSRCTFALARWIELAQLKIAFMALSTFDFGSEFMSDLKPRLASWIAFTYLNGKFSSGSSQKQHQHQLWVGGISFFTSQSAVSVFKQSKSKLTLISGHLIMRANQLELFRVKFSLFFRWMLRNPKVKMLAVKQIAIESLKVLEVSSVSKFFCWISSRSIKVQSTSIRKFAQPDRGKVNQTSRSFSSLLPFAIFVSDVSRQMLAFRPLSAGTVEREKISSLCETVERRWIVMRLI